jgi:hypothetical protein
MTPAVRCSLVVALLHVAMVASLGGKLLFDRSTRPHVWARAAPVDPNMPIRGRYVSLRLEAAIGPGLSLTEQEGTPVSLIVENDRLVAVPAADSTGLTAHGLQRAGERVAVIDQPVAYFIPERAADPSIRPAGEELWVEVTLPSRGRPRPIRIGVRKDGTLTPLELQ